MSAGRRKVVGLILGAAAAAGAIYAVAGRRKSPTPSTEDDVVAQAPSALAPNPAPPPAPPGPPSSPATRPAPSRAATDAGSVAPVTPPTEPLNPGGRTAPLSAAEYAAEQMQILRQLVDTDPQRAVDMARQANRRFPRSPDVPERSWIVVKGLANLKRFQEARDEARALVAKYPGNRFARDAERDLLVDP
jgi:hypothetical protein